eukprot:scpid24403/ scgid19344/ 
MPMDSSKSPGRSSRKRKHSASESQGSRECVICLEQPKERGKISCCDHLFCFDCITKWAKVTNCCPLCKAQFNKVEKTTLGGERVKGSRSRTVKNKQQDVWYDSDADSDDTDTDIGSELGGLYRSVFGFATNLLNNLVSQQRPRSRPSSHRETYDFNDSFINDSDSSEEWEQFDHTPSQDVDSDIEITFDSDVPQVVSTTTTTRTRTMTVRDGRYSLRPANTGRNIVAPSNTPAVPLPGDMEEISSQLRRNARRIANVRAARSSRLARSLGTAVPDDLDDVDLQTAIMESMRGADGARPTSSMGAAGHSTTTFSRRGEQTVTAADVAYQRPRRAPRSVAARSAMGGVASSPAVSLSRGGVASSSLAPSSCARTEACGGSRTRLGVGGLRGASPAAAASSTTAASHSGALRNAEQLNRPRRAALASLGVSSRAADTRAAPARQLYSWQSPLVTGPFERRSMDSDVFQQLYVFEAETTGATVDVSEVDSSSISDSSSSSDSCEVNDTDSDADAHMDDVAIVEEPQVPHNHLTTRQQVATATAAAKAAAVAANARAATARCYMSSAGATGRRNHRQRPTATEPAASSRQVSSGWLTRPSNGATMHLLRHHRRPRPAFDEPSTSHVHQASTEVCVSTSPMPLPSSPFSSCYDDSGSEQNMPRRSRPLTPLRSSHRGPYPTTWRKEQCHVDPAFFSSPSSSTGSVQCVTPSPTIGRAVVSSGLRRDRSMLEEADDEEVDLHVVPDSVEEATPASDGQVVLVATPTNDGEVVVVTTPELLPKVEPTGQPSRRRRLPFGLDLDSDDDLEFARFGQR